MFSRSNWHATAMLCGKAILSLSGGGGGLEFTASPSGRQSLPTRKCSLLSVVVGRQMQYATAVQNLDLVYLVPKRKTIPFDRVLLMLIGVQHKNDCCLPWHQLVDEVNRNKLANDGSQNPGFLQQWGWVLGNKDVNGRWLKGQESGSLGKPCVLLDADKELPLFRFLSRRKN